MSATALIHAQHLLGIGHLTRAAALAKALDSAGIAVTLLTGGPRTARLDAGGAEIVHLPPVKSADAAFSGLVDAAGAPVSEALLGERRQRVRDLVRRLRPDLVVTETYPFGRRQLRGEYETLLATATARRPRPLIAASVRDILQTGRKTERIDEAVDAVRRHYDLVLVHGDPRFVGLDATFPRFDAIADRCRYTGFVDTATPTSASADADGRDEVVVSAGGGAVGAALFEAALAACAAGAAGERCWRFLVGTNVPDADLAAWRARAPRRAIVERARPDFRALLARAALSVSQAGYNTVLDLLASGTPAVLVPFADGGQTEQTLRARRLHDLGLGIQVDPARLAAEPLSAAADRALAMPRPAIRFDTDGARRSAELLSRLLAGAPVG